MPDGPRVYAAVAREPGRPTDGHTAVSMTWVFTILALALWSGWYLGDQAAGFDSTRMDGDPLHVPVGKAAPVALDPIARGKRVFEAMCATCHQSSGLGVPSTYPPLAGSEWVTGDPETLVRIVLDGLEGPVSVGGHEFNGIMPAWKATLDDKRLAAVASYIRASWGNQATPIEPAFAQRVRGAMATRTRAWIVSDLSHARDEGK